MSRLSLSRAWEESKEIFSRDGALLSAVALALILLPEIVVGVVSPPAGDGPVAERAPACVCRHVRSG